MPVTITRRDNLKGVLERQLQFEAGSRPTGVERTTDILWTDHTWNPFVGCSVHTAGCTNCYAMKQAAVIIGRNPNVKQYQGVVKVVNNKPVWTGLVNLSPEHILNKPLKTKQPSMFFVNSMSDFFHENAQHEWREKVMGIIEATPQHIYQILTKRPENIDGYMQKRGKALPANVWLGATVERGDFFARIAHLIATPAKVHFLSVEPLIGDMAGIPLEGVEWVIVGGESGHSARRMKVEWARQVRDACLAAKVPFFFKQYGTPQNNPLWGEATGSPYRYVEKYDPIGKGGSLLDGVSYKEFPVDCQGKV